MKKIYFYISCVLSPDLKCSILFFILSLGPVSLFPSHWICAPVLKLSSSVAIGVFVALVRSVVLSPSHFFPGGPKLFLAILYAANLLLQGFAQRASFPLSNSSSRVA
jgi:hypothetical protein